MHHEIKDNGKLFNSTGLNNEKLSALSYFFLLSTKLESNMFISVQQNTVSCTGQASVRMTHFRRMTKKRSTPKESAGL